MRADDPLSLTPIRNEGAGEVAPNSWRETVGAESVPRLAEAIEEELVSPDDAHPCCSLERTAEGWLDGGEPAERKREKSVSAIETEEEGRKRNALHQWHQGKQVGLNHRFSRYELLTNDLECLPIGRRVVRRVLDHGHELRDDGGQ